MARWRGVWVATVSVVAAGLAAPQLPASGSAPGAGKPPAPRVVERSYPAGTHRAGLASPAAPVEVAGLRSASSNTFSLGNGLYRTDTYTGPVNFTDAKGAWQRIDDTLAPAAGGRWANRAGPFTVSLPGDVSGPVRVRQGGVWASFTLRGAKATGSAAGNTVTYRDALPGVTVRYAVTRAGVKESIDLASPGRRASSGTRWPPARG